MIEALSIFHIKLDIQPLVDLLDFSPTGRQKLFPELLILFIPLVQTRRLVEHRFSNSLVVGCRGSQGLVRRDGINGLLLLRQSPAGVIKLGLLASNLASLFLFFIPCRPVSSLLLLEKLLQNYMVMVTRTSYLNQRKQRNQQTGLHGLSLLGFCEKAMWFLL